ncbi:YidB family protein [Teredinibacter waterburyi]|jgi:Bacterial protein of unknown function (DUF937).|uniref:YidB family protein n=1 Tax=Teredinibacter waterburyi TaxID=1500538 RepID=UPI00165FE777|nr:YidB family protein [Teredinibacter waterburyi]
MDLLDVAAKLFISKMGSSGSGLDVSKVIGGLSGLLPMTDGKLDLGSIVGLLSKNKNLASLAASWLGDGGNSAFSPSDVLGLLGESKVKGFAQSLGLDQDAATGGLAQMIPDLIDSNSKGGALLDMAKESLGKKLLKGFFS